MPITSGSLTARLGQFLADIAGFFSTANAEIALIRSNSDTLISSAQILGKVNLASIRSGLINVQNQLDAVISIQSQTNTLLGQISTGIGTVTTQPSIRANLNYLTQSGDGTALNRNIQSIVDQVFDLTGTRPDNATLWDLRQALVSPSGSRLQTIIEKLDILLDEKLGTPPNSLTGLELLQLAADCICELNGKFPALPPPPPPTPGIVPQESLCAAGLDLLWELKPSDWRQDGQGVWYAAPIAVFTAGVGYTLEDFDTGPARGIQELVVADQMNGARLLQCGIAVSLETGSLETITRDGYAITSLNPDEAVTNGLTDNVDNVFNTAAGCKTIQLIGVEGVNDAMRFTGVLRAGASFPPLETIWFYALPPN